MSIITIAIIVAILTAFGYGEVNGQRLARTARCRPTRQRLAPQTAHDSPDHRSGLFFVRRQSVASCNDAHKINWRTWRLAEAQFRMAHRPSLAVMASPRPTRYGPRSQAFSPCRGSDPGGPCTPRHRREPAPGEPADVEARSRVSPDPHRLARPLTARWRPRLRPRHSRPRGPAVSPPQRPSLDRPIAAAVPRGTDGRRRCA